MQTTSEKMKAVRAAKQPDKRRAPRKTAVQDEAWGITDVEKYVGVSRVTIWKLYKKGKFPAPRYVLRHRKWWKSEVVRWLEAQQVRAPQTVAMAGGAR